MDPDRALQEFRNWIKNPPAQKELQSIAVGALGWVGNEEALNLALEMIPDKDVGELAIMSANNLIGARSFPGPVFPPAKTAKLWAIAKKRLTDTTAPENLSKNARDAYNWMVGTTLRANEPPK